MTEALDTTNPDLRALTLTVGLCRELVDADAKPAAWTDLTRALVAEHTPEELANMLTGACTILARASRTA